MDVHLFCFDGGIQPLGVRRYLAAGNLVHEFTQHAGIGGEIFAAIDLAHLALLQHCVEHIHGVDEKPRLVISWFQGDTRAVENCIQITQIEDLKTVKVAMQGHLRSYAGKRLSHNHRRVKLIPKNAPAFRHQMTAETMDPTRRDMGMPLAADNTKVTSAIQFLAIAQHMPMVIGRVNAINVRMLIQDPGNPRRCGASPGNNIKQLGTWVFSKKCPLIIRKALKKFFHFSLFHFGGGYKEGSSGDPGRAGSCRRARRFLRTGFCRSPTKPNSRR